MYVYIYMYVYICQFNFFTTVCYKHDLFTTNNHQPVLSNRYTYICEYTCVCVCVHTYASNEIKTKIQRYHSTTISVCCSPQLVFFLSCNCFLSTIHPIPDTRTSEQLLSLYRHGQWQPQQSLLSGSCGSCQKKDQATAFRSFM